MRKIAYGTIKQQNICSILLQTTYEEFRLNEADVGDKMKWLKEGMDCNLLFWKGKVIWILSLSTTAHKFLFFCEEKWFFPFLVLYNNYFVMDT